MKSASKRKMEAVKAVAEFQGTIKSVIIKKSKHQKAWEKKHPGRTYTDDKFILKGGKIVPEFDLHKWADWFEDGKKNRQIHLTKVGKFNVSTIFAGMNLEPSLLSIMGKGKKTIPVMFETMVFTKMTPAQAAKKNKNFQDSWKMIQKSFPKLGKGITKGASASLFKKANKAMKGYKPFKAGSWDEVYDFPQQRYTTLKEATAGHKAVVKTVKKSLAKKK